MLGMFFFFFFFSFSFCFSFFFLFLLLLLCLLSFSRLDLSLQPASHLALDQCKSRIGADIQSNDCSIPTNFHFPSPSLIPNYPIIHTPTPTSSPSAKIPTPKFKSMANNIRFPTSTTSTPNPPFWWYTLCPFRAC